MRPPPPEQVSISSRGWRAQLVEHSVERERLRVDERTIAPVAACDGLHEVAVVVPLEIVDVVLGDEGADAFEYEVVRVGVGDVENLLVPRRGAGALAGRKHPVGVGAGEVGVRTDHLGLEPQAELHAPGPHSRHERAETVGPDGLVNQPVAQARGRVSPPSEPAVVEHDPFDSDLGGAIGDLDEPVQVVVEVDGLPRVEHERPRCDGVVRRARRRRWKRAETPSSPRSDHVNSTVGAS